MPRNDAEKHELSDAEKRDLIGLIDEGMPQIFNFRNNLPGMRQ